LPGSVGLDVGGVLVHFFAVRFSKQNGVRMLQS
jgi:hypothetical protein